MFPFSVWVDFFVFKRIYIYFFVLCFITQEGKKSDNCCCSVQFVSDVDLSSLFVRKFAAAELRCVFSCRYVQRAFLCFGMEKVFLSLSIDLW